MSALQNARMRAGLSQGKLAEASGVKLRAIQAYEVNDRTTDKAMLETLCDLAIACGCTLFDILENDDLKEKLRRCI